MEVVRFVSFEILLEEITRVEDQETLNLKTTVNRRRCVTDYRDYVKKLNKIEQQDLWKK